ADDDISKVRVLLVRAGDVGAILDPLVHQKARPQANGSDIARHRADSGEVRVVRELHVPRRERLAKLGLVEVAVARKHDRNDLSRLVSQQEGLKERASRLPQRSLESLDARGCGRRDLAPRGYAVGAREMPLRVS